MGFPALLLDGCQPCVANVLPAREPVPINIRGLFHGEVVPSRPVEVEGDGMLEFR
jgi:hypothetical protein